MIFRGKGENKEHCDKVIKDVLEHWDEAIGKTTNEIIKSGGQLCGEGSI